MTKIIKLLTRQLITFQRGLSLRCKWETTMIHLRLFPASPFLTCPPTFFYSHLCGPVSALQVKIPVLFNKWDPWPSQSFPVEKQLPSIKIESYLPQFKLTACCLIHYAHGEQIVAFCYGAAGHIWRQLSSSLSSLYLAKDKRSASYNTNAIWTSSFPSLEKHSSFFSGQRTAENDLMSSESKKFKSLFNEIKIGLASARKQPPF